MFVTGSVTGVLVTGSVTGVLVTGAVTGTIGSVTGTIGSVTGGVIGTVDDLVVGVSIVLRFRKIKVLTPITEIAKNQTYILHLPTNIQLIIKKIGR